MQHFLNESIKKFKNRGFPGGLVVKNPPANAGDRGSIRGLEWFHMPWNNEARALQLLNLALETEKCNHWARVPQLLSPHALEPMLRNKRSTAVRSLHTTTREQPPLAVTRERPMRQQRLSTAKKINKWMFKEIKK